MNLSALAAACGVVLFPLAMIYAGLMDIATMKIRNVLVAAVGVGWLVLAPLAGFSLHDLAASLGVAGIVLVVSFTFFALGWIGGGDAKLAAVTALWFRPDEALLYFAATGVLGGLLTMVVLQLRAGYMPPQLYRMHWVAQLQQPGAGVPYGAAMAPAALIVFPNTDWIAHASRLLG